VNHLRGCVPGFGTSTVSVFMTFIEPTSRRTADDWTGQSIDIRGLAAISGASEHPQRTQEPVDQGAADLALEPAARRDARAPIDPPCEGRHARKRQAVRRGILERKRRVTGQAERRGRAVTRVGARVSPMFGSVLRISIVELQAVWTVRTVRRFASDAPPIGYILRIESIGPVSAVIETHTGT
jgi:hypothetical protein